MEARSSAENVRAGETVVGGRMSRSRVWVWVCFHVKRGHKCLAGEQRRREIIIRARHAVRLIAIPVSVPWCIAIWVRPRRGRRNGEEKTPDCKTGVLEEIPIFLGIGVEIG